MLILTYNKCTGSYRGMISAFTHDLEWRKRRWTS